MSGLFISSHSCFSRWVSYYRSTLVEKKHLGKRARKLENHTKTRRPPDANHLKSSMRWAHRGGDLEAEWISGWDEVASILSNERFCQKTDLSR